MRVGHGVGRGLAWLALGALCALTGCARAVRPEVREPELPRLEAAEVARLIPSRVKDREGWAKDVLAALEAQQLAAAPPAVCAVLAIIEQESGFQADPAVPGLPKMVRERLESHAGKLGPLGRPALQAMLEGRAPGDKRSFEARLGALRTERDLDRLFRDMLAHQEREHPGLYAAADLASQLVTSEGLEALNPVTTAGSMQVSVRFAQERAGEDVPLAQVREELYTRRGGVLHGTARLLGHEAGYDKPLYRFADYNAGLYASRNAALQEQLTRLTGHVLVPDGDVLLYDKQGEPRSEDSRTLLALLAFRARYAPSLGERQVRRDAREEKKAEFEATDTYRAVKREYERRTGQGAAYARLPEVVLRGPKLAKERSTAWFARSVDARFQRCMERHRAPAR
ncbi:DUF1615 family protein [Myxococcaceae bacterium GXIMD 01537]